MEEQKKPSFEEIVGFLNKTVNKTDVMFETFIGSFAEFKQGVQALASLCGDLTQRISVLEADNKRMKDLESTEQTKIDLPDETPKE